MENYIPVHSTPIQYTGHPSQVDVAVLILFFNRPEPLSAVFEQVRKARPSKLFLYQDGARGEKDMPGILACRKVVDEIDWECEVYQWYQEKNFGCDPSEYLSQKWAFLLSRNASYLKTMTYLPSASLLSARNCSTDMKTIAASA